MQNTRERQAAFQALWERHRGIAIRIAHAYASNTDDRQDLEQEIRVNLWESFPRYRDQTKFSTWMYRVALNTAITHLRRQKPPTAPIEDVHPAASPDPEISAVLQQVLASLDPANRALLILYMEGNSHDEMGDILGITPGSVATRISRLKDRLRQENEPKVNQ